MLGREPIIEVDRQISRCGKLHAELSKRSRAAQRPPTAVQINHHRMRSGPLGYRNVSAEALTQVDFFFESTDRREIEIVDGRQFFPSHALRGNIAGRIPSRQRFQNPTVVFADHGDWRLTNPVTASPAAAQAGRLATPPLHRPMKRNCAASTAPPHLPLRSKHTNRTASFGVGAWNWAGRDRRRASGRAPLYGGYR
jgi:hypothetical protein